MKALFIFVICFGRNSAIIRGRFTAETYVGCSEQKITKIKKGHSLVEKLKDSFSSITLKPICSAARVATSLDC
jgi:hypothetical protein